MPRQMIEMKDGKSFINYSTNPKTRKEQIANEKRVLTHIKYMNRTGRLYRPLIPSMAWWHAIDRLEVKGLIRFYKPGNFGVSGYIARGFVVRRGKIYRVKYNRKFGRRDLLNERWSQGVRWGIPEEYGEETLIGEVRTGLA